MKQTLLMIVPLLVGVLLFSTCEEPTKPDTTPPSVTITSPQSGSIVSEVVSVTCISTDNEGVERVELWIDGVSTGITDNTEPYSMDWNTTTYENKSYTITIRSNDVNDNMTDSDPITLIVDNSGSYPQSISIISIVFGDGSFTITWNQSSDGDFASYDLEKSVESTMGDYDVVYSTEAVTDTTYVDSDVDPLNYQYYRITVIDTFSYGTKGQIVSSSLDPLPTSIDVTSVTYTSEEMTVEWEESPDSDFNDYKLLYSDSESGDRDTVVTYTDKSTTDHIITDFDPTHENWFWVLVSDSLGQSTIGGGMSNLVDNAPTPVDITELSYTDQFLTMKWERNIDFDFVSYEIQYSENSAFDLFDILISFHDPFDTTYTQYFETSFDQRYYFRIQVKDHWGLVSNGNSIVLSTYKKIAYKYDESNNGDEKLMLIDYDGEYEEMLSDQYDYNRVKWNYNGDKVFFNDDNYLKSIDINTREVNSHIYYGGGDFAISSNSTNVVFRSEVDGSIHIFDYESGTDTQIMVHSGRNFSISPNESFISFVDAELYVLDVVNSILDTIYDVNGTDTHPSWNFSSNKIAFHDSEKNIIIYDISAEDFVLYTGSFANPTFYSDSDNLCVHKEEGYYFFDESFNIIGIPNLSTGGYNSYSFNKDNSRIAVLKKGDYYNGGWRQSLYVINTDTFEYYQLTDNKYRLYSFDWQP